MKYGIIYIKLTWDWLKYCYRLKSYPPQLQEDITTITNKLNEKFKDDMIIPLSLDALNGCIVKEDKADEIANELYNEYIIMTEKHDIGQNVKLVYSVGEIKKEYLKVKTIHQLHHFDTIVKVGHKLDENHKNGKWKI